MKPHRNNGRCCAKCSGLCEYSKDGKRLPYKIRLLRSAVFNLSNHLPIDQAEYYNEILKETT